MYSCSSSPAFFSDAIEKDMCLWAEYGLLTCRKSVFKQPGNQAWLSLDGPIAFGNGRAIVIDSTATFGNFVVPAMTGPLAYHAGDFWEQARSRASSRYDVATYAPATTSGARMSNDTPAYAPLATKSHARARVDAPVISYNTVPLFIEPRLELQAFAYHPKKILKEFAKAAFAIREKDIAPTRVPTTAVTPLLLAVPLGHVPLVDLAKFPFNCESKSITHPGRRTDAEWVRLWQARLGFPHPALLYRALGRTTVYGIDVSKAAKHARRTLISVLANQQRAPGMHKSKKKVNRAAMSR
jgi:hypothetical protein